MHQLRPRFVIGLSLALAGSGLAAAACSSESNETTSDEQLSPDPNAEGTGGSNAMPEDMNPGDGDPTGAAGTGGTTNEGQGGNVPIDEGDPDPASTAGAAGTTGMQEPPAPTGLAPNCNPPEGDVPNLTLELVADGLDDPLYVTGAPGDDSRLFVVEKGGAVRVLLNGELQQTPFINLSNQLDNGAERGLLGLAFHPEYATNGLFYAHFSSNGGDGLPPDRDTVIAEFRVDANDRSVADASSRRILLTVDQPAGNHNGGALMFGPDALLYLGLGDGGNGNDQFGQIGNGQNLNTLLGKILRIDPLGRSINDSYDIPVGNMVDQGEQALPEIWAYGLRNPWRFSFDACNGDLYIGDVGQDDREEIDFLAANEERSITAGANFGWRIMEGEICRPGGAGTNECTDQSQVGLILPVDTYETGAVGNSITGGYVYRGSNVPGLRGTYIYGDYTSARFFRFRIQNGQLTDRVEITDQMRPAGGGNIDNIASFGTDNAGEMYVAAFVPGAVYRVAAAQ